MRPHRRLGGGAMNRHQRRAAEAQARKLGGQDKARAVAQAMQYLAIEAASTVTGATLLLPDGSSLYISASDAQALYGRGTPRGRA
jgi:hypothetical protein